MFHNENGGTFWIAKDSFPVPVQMAIYVDSSYDSPNAPVKESFKHHSSGFVFWTGGGTLREVNYGLTRQDYKPERLVTSDNAELIGINKVLKYVLAFEEKPERLTIVCDNQTLVKKLNDIREVYKILGKFPASEYPKSLHKAEYDTYMHLMRSFSNIELTFQHIKGHADSHFNHIADRLAHLGKSIRSGEEHPEGLILKNLAIDSASWHTEYLPKEVSGEFILGISENSHVTKGGIHRQGVCFYDAKNQVFHKGVFESTSKIEKEKIIIGAIHGLEMIYELMPKGANVNVIVPNVFTANILHAYVSDYVIPEGLLSRNTVTVLNDHRKSLKKFGTISFLVEGQSAASRINLKACYAEACVRANTSVEEYSYYRSLYETTPSGSVTEVQSESQVEEVA